MLACAVLGAVSIVVPAASATADPAVPGCGADHFVAGWTASVTDAVTPLDPTGTVVPSVVSDQSFRMMITPHLGGSTLRIRLSNRFGLTPVTFGAVTVGTQDIGAAVRNPRPVTFGAGRSAVVPAGAEIVSDPVELSFAAFTRLAVSIHVAGTAGPPTKHWNANATSYYSPTGSGDLTGGDSGAGFTEKTYSWLYVDALEVSAPASTRSIVAFGDSITDGMITNSPVGVPAEIALADTDGRYPDVLQRRLDAAGIPLSVANAGIGSNRLVTDGQPLMLGPSGIQRFRRDALEQAGVAGVLVLEGINDLGLPPQANADQMISGLRQVVAEARQAGVKIWLGTILPAADALVNGVAIAPASEDFRQRINAWIRTQQVADGVVDFDAALRDPVDPTVLARGFSGPDRLHPNLAGYRAMADAVDLTMLAEALEC
ncbi:GDSL-type esterase/lipase family protein [Nocardia sp. NPDC005978]|uniref:GDSL-type esterase/lipase family protein n=1 Tax=Nocardia sp. NPDC005978 TaxID=3156725 RepID=UPI0033ACD2C6